MTDFTNISKIPEWARQMACDKANARVGMVVCDTNDIPHDPTLTELAIMCWQFCEEPVDPDLLIAREALKDASVSLSWAARQMKGNCSGSAVDAVNLAAGNASSAAALTGRQG